MWEIDRLLKVKNNQGSAVVEICLLTPFLIGIVFLSINLFFVVMNKSVVMEEGYTALYTKEVLMSDIGDEYKAVMQSNLDCIIKNNSVFMKETDVNITSNKNNSTLINNAAPFDKGNFIISISYKNDLRGIIFRNESICNDEYEAGCEIRDTSNNLRRWQLYGYSISN